MKRILSFADFDPLAANILGIAFMIAWRKSSRP